MIIAGCRKKLHADWGTGSGVIKVSSAVTLFFSLVWLARPALGAAQSARFSPDLIFQTI